MREFFDLLARHGVRAWPLALYTSAVSPEVDHALRGAGIVKRGPPARTFACGADDPGCLREVRGFDDDVGRGHSPLRADGAYVAVCSQTPHACDAVDVPTDALAQISVHRAPLARAIVDALAFTPARQTHHKAPPPRDDEPLLLGDADDRDVHLLVHPRADLAHRLAARARDPRRALFLVPTALGLDPALFANHGPDAHVELGRLDDLLLVRGDAIAAAPRLRAVPSLRRPKLPTRALATDARPLPPLERWNLLRVCLVDGETILLTVGGQSSRRTYLDMGLAAKGNRKPLKAWKVLVALLEGEGQLTWHPFGNYLAVAQEMTTLRKCLKAALALDDDPFEALARRLAPPLRRDARAATGQSFEEMTDWWRRAVMARAPNAPA